MLATAPDDGFYRLEKLIPLIQPSLSLGQVFPLSLGRHELGQGFSPLGDEDLLLSVRHASQKFREVLLGFRDIYSMFSHLINLLDEFMVMMTTSRWNVK
jgi:hypothetical protein